MADSVRPHQHRAGDVYCVFRITQKRGPGALNVNDKVCIYCANPNDRCPSTKTITPADGIEYDLVNLSNTCTDCQTDVNTGAYYEEVGAGGGGGGTCFIATAVYGPESRQLDVLREFRDGRLLSYPAGRAIVSLYYSLSSPVARVIGRSAALRAVARWLLDRMIRSISRETRADRAAGTHKPRRASERSQG